MHTKKRNVKKIIIGTLGTLNWSLIIETNLIIWDYFILADVML